MDILSRRVEIVVASGRKNAAAVQMKMFDNVFHKTLHTAVQPNQVKAWNVQLSYARASSINAALQHQEAILKEMHAAQQSGITDVNPEDDVGKAVLHNL